MAYLVHVSCLSTTTVSQLFEPQLKKIVIFAYPGLHFLFALGTTLWQSRKKLHEWKDNSVLVKPLTACTHLSSTVSQLFEQQLQKIAVFRYRSPHFCFPGRRPCDYHAICCMDGKTIQCLPNPSQHCLSIFNSFRFTGCLSQCVSPKIAIFTTFVSPGDAPGAITLNVVWMKREFDAYKLSCCMCPSNYNCFWDRTRYLWKIVIFSYPLTFDAPVTGVPVGIAPPRVVWKN